MVRCTVISIPVQAIYAIKIQGDSCTSNLLYRISTHTNLTYVDICQEQRLQQRN